MLLTKAAGLTSLQLHACELACTSRGQATIQTASTLKLSHWVCYTRMLVTSPHMETETT
jgi:hypothetical protein